ncbi:MAG: glycerophosphodiester phosphodiesterase [Dehalococcoidia bacterium]|nr:glycerophosphodiester phosphodiesterase [Dehalococcoidia bacterium]
MAEHQTAIVSHRAHCGTHPENTLLGIQAALDDGVEAIEIDVRRTIDGGLVLMHDTTFTRTTGDRRVVSETSTAEATALQVLPPDSTQQPQPVPLLEDALRLIDGKAAIVIDFEDAPIADDLIALVKQMGAASWTWWTSHDPHLAERLAAETPGSKSYLGWAASDRRFASPIDALDVCVRRGLAGINAQHTYVDETVVRYAHRESLEVGVWTVNDPKRMGALLRMGVDAITTDFPRATQLMRDRAASATEAAHHVDLRFSHGA